MKNRKLLTVIIAAILCMTVSIGIALAYFTDYESARGGAVLNLTGQTEIEEEVKDNQKIVKISNIGKTDMIVRVMVYGDERYLDVPEAENWKKGSDGAYYYTSILKPGKSTEPELLANIKEHKAGDESTFDVIVVHEANRVMYDDDQKLVVPAGWDKGIVKSIKAE